MEAARKEAVCRKRLKTRVLKRRLRLTRSVRDAQALGVALRNESRRVDRLAACVSGSCRRGLDCFEERQDAWEESILSELDVMAREQGIPVHAGDERVAGRPARRGAAPEPKFLYDSEDLLEALRSVGASLQVPDGPARAAGSAGSRRCWSRGALGLATEPIEALRRRFAELHPSIPQVGVDDDDATSSFARQHEALGHKLAKIGSVQLAERYLRQGSTPALRTKLYRIVLQDSSRIKVQSVSARPARQGGAAQSDAAADANDDLETSSLGSGSSGPGSSTCSSGAGTGAGGGTGVARKSPDSVANGPGHAVFDETVVDRLHALDLELIRNNDNYFVFEDLLRNILPVLFRGQMDWLRLHSRVVSRLEHACAVPFYGLAMQTAPLAYVFRSESEITSCMREMFARYWCQLNVLRNGRDGALTLLPNLCAQFEDLVLATSPRAVHHMVCLGVYPLDIAFPWIHLAFANALAVEELLLLWDRLLGFDSLVILPVLAAAIFRFREATILRASTAKQVRDLMRETVTMRVVPLLQAFLFCDQT